MTFNKVEEDNPAHARANFDFNCIVLPRCDDRRWSGLAFVGQPGLVLNLVAYDLDPALIYELAHNLGLNHGARSEGGERGKAVWETEYVDKNTASPVGGHIEYSSPLTPLGRGKSFNGGHFMLPAKHILEWTPQGSLVQIGASISCRPCGPYMLQPLDKGVLTGTHPTGIMLETGVSGRYFWIEHRTIVTAGSAAVL
jgi:hypothetical protein